MSGEGPLISMKMTVHAKDDETGSWVFGGVLKHLHQFWTVHLWI